ncbi:Oxidoreductase [Exophiala dermatitidis]|uniref:Mitochondrial intermembrane space import and assembly protein 40 n=2 Tax=Exophiala dermatitidis TaxID=5970 RepID=H6BPA6_EXODN|nr:chromosome transmission fidelity protein 18 [Exophiala dermatitidis NIH/UT8656]KAJ4518931.1 Oxidoreductase [Exophiala dermatitidis]EHY53561.1 chromosome transmission fidelity protein 18 [Exophiala dermatitidis NIH/UT8656]KAJ4529592.1 Oxidoreductase [Exophiala dermatitidis]KAJ4543746.1 Oxidoreductase [Exophiala dermatitidis]KAJ4557420.1 Oxidoreductase [Exophiala dermatitidis]
MFRPAARSLVQSAPRPYLIAPRTVAGRRFVSTSPVNARRSWKSTFLRWGIAIAGIYYYNTSPVFAEQPQHNLLNPNVEAVEETFPEESPLEALTSRRKQQTQSNSAALHAAADTVSSENASTSVAAQENEPISTGSAGELEEEAANEGAFNPETGEINWDCPCLGGMAHGPCGPEFREAFSCFVYSTEEPKGMDCIDKFQNMQQCFQRYPEVYKGELEDDEELDAGLEAEKQELVNEIKERKAQQQQRQQESQHRLLEEPTSAPAPSKPAQTGEKPATEPQQEKSVTSQETQTRSDDKQTQSTHTQSSKPPQEPSKVKIHDDPTMSPERENITEGQKSSPVSQPKPSPAADDGTIPEDDIVPRAAHDARGNSGVTKRDTEK